MHKKIANANCASNDCDILELGAGTLNQLQYDEFKTMCMNLIMTDNQISFFEYTVFCMLTIILDSTITSNERNNSQGNEHQEIEYTQFLLEESHQNGDKLPKQHLEKMMLHTRKKKLIDQAMHKYISREVQINKWK